MKKLVVLAVALSVLALSGVAHAGMRIGAMNVGLLGGLIGGGGFGAFPTIGTSFNESMSGDLGLAIGQDATGTNTNIAILGRMEWVIGKVGELKTLAGGNLVFATNPGYAATAQSAFFLNGFLGAEYMLGKSLGLVGTLTLLELYSTSGTTQIGLGSGTIGGTGLTTAPVNLFAGARLYL